MEDLSRNWVGIEESNRTGIRPDSNPIRIGIESESNLCKQRLHFFPEKRRCVASFFGEEMRPLRIGILELSFLRNPLQRFIDPGIYPGFIRDLSGIYPGFIWDLSGIYPGFIRDLSGIYLGFIRDLSGIYPGFIRDISGIYFLLKYLSKYLSIFKYLYLSILKYLSTSNI